jgi:leader peptidase (prepilin peptidase) / N-methyltransferase
MNSFSAVLESWWLPVFVAPFIGSFLGVLITRLPAGEAVVVGRSRCSWCGHVLGAFDLVPLLSWFALSRRCRYCGSPLGWFYPNVELAAVVVPVWAATEVGGWLLWATCGLGWVLLTLAAIDARHQVLPDVLTLPLIAGGLAVAALIDVASVFDHALAAVIGFSAFWLIARCYRAMRGREGLGLGDAKFLAAAGAWVSWQGLPGVVFIGAASALVVALIRIAAGAKPAEEQRIPFGTYLCLSTWLVWLYGPLIVR